MTYKIANISDPGTSTKHGADDLDKIAKLLGNQSSDAVEIASAWKFSQTGGTLLKEITEPSSPASGYASLYIDSTTKSICIKKSNGDVVVIG